MSDLRELYQELIVDHYKSPRNFREIDEPVRRIDGYNPLCGDRITLFVRVDESGAIEDIAFQGVGCAISTASASMMTDLLKGKKIDEAEELRLLFQEQVTSDDDSSGGAELGVLEGKLGELEALSDPHAGEGVHTEAVQGSRDRLSLRIQQLGLGHDVDDDGGHGAAPSVTGGGLSHSTDPRPLLSRPVSRQVVTEP